MSWLDKYRQASFRNVNFYVPSHEHSGGRRNAVHELPGRDTPDVRDLGSGLKKFSIDAYVIGEDYNYDRDALLEALDKGGSGKLVHPYLGTLRVVADSYTLREQSTERRIARFSLTFIQSGLQQFPSVEVAPAELVVQRKEEALLAVQADFNKSYDLTNKTYSTVDSSKSNLSECIGRIERFRKVTSVSAAFQKDLQDLQSNIISLAYDVSSLSVNLTNIINFGTDLGLELFTLTSSNGRTLYDELKFLWQSLDDAPLEFVNSADPSILISQLVQRVAVVSAAGLFNIMEFKSWDEARERQRTLFDKIQSLADDSADDAVFASLMDLRSAVYKEFETKEGSLPRLVIYTPSQTTNSLFLTYYLYGSLDKEQEILDRNKIEHPGFIPGQRSLEVILDVY